MATIPIKYSDQGWKQESRTMRGRNGYEQQVVDVQTVWLQLDQDEWLSAELVRTRGHNSYVFVSEAFIRRDLQPSGRWRWSQTISQDKLRLEADQRVRNTTPPEPKQATHAGARHIARTPYAIPGRGEEAEPPAKRYTLQAVTKG